MNRTVVIKYKQSLYDIAIEHCGDVRATNMIADMNDISPDDELEYGSEIILPSVYNPSVVNKLNINRIHPASYLNSDSVLEGVNYWAVGLDFVVQ